MYRLHFSEAILKKGIILVSCSIQILSITVSISVQVLPTTVLISSSKASQNLLIGSTTLNVNECQIIISLSSAEKPQILQDNPLTILTRTHIQREANSANHKDNSHHS